MLANEAYSHLMKKNDTIGIEIRCIRVDGKHYYESTWPDLGDIEINNH